MSLQYKSEDGWKNISSSSNNAVDAITDGNMSPVTSNAVYDKFATQTSAITIDTSAFNVNSWSVLRRSGNVVTLTGRCWKEEQMTLQSGLVIGHVPEGFRPTTDTYFTAHIFEPNTTQVLILISPNGNITTLGSAATVSRMDFYINMSWII